MEQGGGGVRKLAIFSFSCSAAVFAANGLLPLTLLVPLGVGLALLASVLWWGMGTKRRRTRLMSVLVLSGVSVGLLWTAAFHRLVMEPARALDGRTVRLEAVVEEYPQQTDYGYSVVVRSDLGGLRKPLTLLYVDEQGAELRPGDRISVIAHCTLADHSLSGEEITYYTAKGIFLLGETYGALEMERPEIPSPTVWPSLLANWLKEGIARSFPADVAPLMQALVTGNRDGLSDQFTTSLQRTGLSHMVVVSGMHLSVLAEIVSVLLGKGKRSTAVLTGVWVIVFCGVVGNTPSVVRAAVMILLLQAAPLFGRENDPPTSLGFALMLLLLWNPFSAAHIGLQLSFASVAGIQLVSQSIQDRLLALVHLDRYDRRRWVRVCTWAPRFCITTLSATLGAMLLTVPLVAVHFGMFSVIAPISNLLTLWAVSLLLLGGVAGGLLGWMLPGVGVIVAVPFTWLGRYVCWVIDALGRFTMASLPLDSFYYRAWLVFVYLLLGIGWLIKGPKRIVLPGCACVTTFCVALLLTSAGFYAGDMTVVALDVGQGQSILVRSGSFLVLMDCGGDGADDAGDVAADYLQALGETKLDLLVISHYHSDHANGIPQLLRRVEVAAIALPDVEPEDPLRQEILALAQEEKIPVHFVREDTTYHLEDGASITLFPPLGEGTDTNELGLTMLATAGSFDTLITGDMSGEVEPLLLEHGNLPEVELLVVGHHGSGTSTTQALLDAIQPEIAVISAGENNRYGHPAQETLERLAAIGAEIYRTDLQGTVTIRANVPQDAA